MTIPAIKMLGRLQSSRLFEGLCNLAPRDHSPKGLERFHRELYYGIQNVFETIGGPILAPVNGQMMGRVQFEELNSATDKNGMGHINNIAALTVMRSGTNNVFWDAHYDTDMMRRSQEPAGRIMVHEITSTLYGNLIQQFVETAQHFEGAHAEEMQVPTDRTLLEARSAFHELSMLSEGWGALFANDVFKHEELLVAESVLSREDYISNPGVFDTAADVIANRHGFTALALLKYEMAHGFEMLVRLMHMPPGFSKTKDEIGLENVISDLAALYFESNRILRQPSILYHLVPKYRLPEHQMGQFRLDIE